MKRNLAKINYRVHTDAIKEHLVPKAVTPAQAVHLYASEADLLNVALFGMTASDWRNGNPDKTGNMRDYATAAQLVCLSNLENLNALFIKDGIPSAERLTRLNAIAIHQMTLLTVASNVKQLGMLVVQDFVWGTVTRNRSRSRKTYYYMDEFHVLLRDPETAKYICLDNLLHAYKI